MSRRDDEPPWLVIADAATSYPVAWCYKRIANGEEDNVWHKFQLLFVATNRLKPQDFAEQ